MRYAIVSETYPPEVNGVALTVQTLECGLRARGHQVDVVRPRQPHDGDGDGADHETLAASLPLPRYPGLRVGLPAMRQLAARWRVAPPAAVYVATEGPLGWSALRIARRMGIPVATGLHTRFDHYMRDYGARWLEPVALHWMRRFHNRADATLVPTLELTQQLHGHGFAHVERLPRAVDSARFDPARRDHELRVSWGIDEAGVAAIHVGRIAAEKNLDLAVAAYRRMQQALRQQGRPEPRFVWVGDGPARAALERANPDFIFCGTQRGDALARYFASGDLFVFPSRSETFGNVTLEAMASGVPTVAFNYGAAREHLQDGLHGAAVTDGDDEAFVAATRRVALDVPMRAAMGALARAAIAHLRPEQVTTDFEALLIRMVERRKHASSNVAQAPFGR